MTEAICEVKICGNRAKKAVPTAYATDFGNQNFIDKLSDELLIEILSRIPNCKFATQCKCISKRWLILISSPFFTSQFLLHQHNRNSTKPLPFALIFNYLDREKRDRTLVYAKDYPADFGSYGFSLEFIPKYLTEQGEQFPMLGIVEAACGDLLLLSMRKVMNLGERRPELELKFEPELVRYYLICNPRTKQWVWLPPLSGCIKSGTRMALVCDPFYSFESTRHGYKCCLHDGYRYRVVSLSFAQPEVDDHVVDVFNSETRQWGKLGVSFPKHDYISLTFGFPPVVYNGMLHFFTSKFHGVNTVKIMAFDPFASGQKGSVVACRSIDLPFKHVFTDYGVCFLGSCLGRLRLSLGLKQGHSRFISVWDLEDYDKGEWCLIHRFSLDNLKFSSCIAHLNRKYNDLGAIDILGVRGFHPYNSDIIYFLFPDGVVEYNMRTRTSQAACEICLRTEHFSNTTVVYINSHMVLLPWWPTPVPALKQDINPTV